MTKFFVERGPGLINLRNQEEKNPKDLIEFLSNSRNDQLNTFFSHCSDEIKQLEQQFGKYIYVPLALPVFELPDKEHFMSWWDRHAIKPQKKVSEFLAPEIDYVSAEAINLIEKHKHLWTPNLQTDNFIKEFPRLWQQFHDLLPIDIISLKMWSSFIPFKEHRDPGELIDIPMSFRIMLFDENPEQTLFILDNPTKPYYCGEDIQIPRVPNTNSWAWNNLRVKHGSVYTPGYKKVLVLTTGIVNVKSYEKLMNKSINIYKDYCITSKYSLENYVDV